MSASIAFAIVSRPARTRNGRDQRALVEQQQVADFAGQFFQADSQESGEAENRR
jgi:hypothetical protein